MRIEITHDILARKVFENASAEQKIRFRAQQMLKDRFSYYKESGILLFEEELEFILPFRKDLNLSPQEIDYLEKSIEKVGRGKRLRYIQIIVFVLFPLLVFTTSGGFYLYYKQQKAIESNEAAREKIYPLIFEAMENNQRVHNNTLVIYSQYNTLLQAIGQPSTKPSAKIESQTTPKPPINNPSNKPVGKNPKAGLNLPIDLSDSTAKAMLKDLEQLELSNEELYEKYRELQEVIPLKDTELQKKIESLPNLERKRDKIFKSKDKE